MTHLDPSHRARAIERLTREIARLSARIAPLDPAPPKAPPPAPAAPPDTAGEGPIDRIAAAFGLSAFERELLLLAAGAECSSSLASAIGRVEGRPGRRGPTFGLALAILPRTDFSALSTAAPLRRHRLIRIEGDEGLVDTPLRIEERVLHDLLGRPAIARELDGIVAAVPRNELDLDSSVELAARLAACWRGRAGAAPILALVGSDRDAVRRIAAEAAASNDLALLRVDAEALPSDRRELAQLARLCQREALLARAALLIECGRADEEHPQREAAIACFVEGLAAPAFVSSPTERPPISGQLAAFDVPAPTKQEQRLLFRRALGDGHEPLIDEIVGQFQLGPRAIEQIGLEARAGGGPSLWDRCRMRTRTRIDHLAQRLDASASWDDLVLPEGELKVLREVAVHVRHRTRVYEDWGFGPRGARGLGVSALFTGVSGTGKTMAAEVIAAALRLDLYRIDLSAVVSKWIGETQKNLRQIFDAAEEGGSVLLFDEADALFGKRSEVKDSRDRHANIEVGYLLQRVESYRGLAVLTTNLKESMDPAFLRRIRFVVDFQFPDRESRARIWSRVIPRRAEADALDFGALSRLDLAGGNIRNVALRAAFLAADQGQRLRMDHLIEAARFEYRKLGRTMPEAVLR